MRAIRVLAVAALTAAATGCILVSGQILIEFAFDQVIAATDSAVQAEQVDLNTIEDYTDNKDKLQGLADLAAIGKVTNLGATAIGVEIWMTRDPTNHLTPGDVRDGGIKLWGPFNLPAGQMRTVDWDGSAALFDAAGKAALLEQVKGDGIFTLYFLAAQGTYSFSVEDGVLILVLDAEL